MPARGYKIKVKRLLEEVREFPDAAEEHNGYIQASLMQTAQTAACNRLHDIAERLARWLLMCHDRMESDSFHITHEFLGHMLGTPRSTVRWPLESCKGGISELFAGKSKHP